MEPKPAGQLLRMNSSSPLSVLSNWRSGCIGIVVFVVAYGALFFVAFMIAFGNDTPVTHAIPDAIGPVLMLANPLWGIPTAYLLGAYLSPREER
jgi:hypothetical protein